MAAGCVRISRDIFDDAAFKDEPFTEREAFMWMVMEASFKARERRVGNEVVSLGRGQLAASTRFMAAAWKWSESRVRRYLGRLSGRRMIDASSDAGITVVTICKYDAYQSPGKGSDAPADHGATQPCLSLSENRRTSVAASDAATNPATDWEYNTNRDAAHDSDAPPERKSTQQRRSSDANENKGYSDTNVSGAEAPPDQSGVDASPDPAKIIFTSGLALLRELGVAERQARSMLGKWRKHHGDAALFEVLGRIRRERPIDPIEFGEGCFRHAARPRDTKVRGGALV